MLRQSLDGSETGQSLEGPAVARKQGVVAKTPPEGVVSGQKDWDVPFLDPVQWEGV